MNEGELVEKLLKSINIFLSIKPRENMRCSYENIIENGTIILMGIKTPVRDFNFTSNALSLIFNGYAINFSSSTSEDEKYNRCCDIINRLKDIYITNDLLTNKIIEIELILQRESISCV